MYYSNSQSNKVGAILHAILSTNLTRAFCYRKDSEEKTMNTVDYCKALSALGIEYKILEHPEMKTPAEVENYFGLTPGEGIPTMIMKTENEFIAVLLREDCRMDFSKIKKAVGAKDIRMATREEFTELTGLTPGAARVYNPGLRTFIDKHVFEKENLYGGSGSFTCTLQYKTADLIKIPNSIVVDITKS